MAGVSLFAQAVVPVSVRAASYPEVYQEAYNYAYDVRVTTQSPIDNAGLYRDITRAEAAKMISNRAENVLGRKVTNNAPTYTDIASLRTSDLYDAIIKAGELGLMNGANGKFRPHDTLTRGEFATIVSRALWGDKYEGGTPYYAQHLNALNTAGIMTVINNPEVNIIRGDVMIMLMRADKEKDSSSNINCDDLLALFEKGSAEYEAAKKICESQAGETGTGGSSTVVKAGDLDVAVTDYSSTIKSAPAVGTVIFNKVEFRASQSVSLNTITVAIAGLTSRSSIDRVWFEKDGVALTSKVKPTTDGTASLTFKGNFAVKSNETLDLVVALSGAAGAEVSFKIANVDSSAYNVNLRDVLSSTYRTTAYKVATLDITTDSTQKVVASTTAPNSTFKLGSQASYTIGKLNIQNNGADNEDRVVNVKSVLLKNAQSTDLSFLKNIQVLRDGTNVAKNVTIDGRNLQITLNDTIQAGKKAIYTIVAEIGNMTDVPSYIQLQLQAFSDVVADEANTNFRTNNTTSFEYPTPPSTLYFNLYKFDGGKITFASDASFPTVVEAASGANDVVIASGTLTLTEPISFKAFSLTGNTGDIRKLSLEIGGVRYVAESSDNGVVRTFKWDEIYVTKTANVKLLANLENNPVQSVTLNPTIISQTIFA
ncbi:MAG: S-layer homology domain-containing protein [Candidatus Peribacteria bacterium]|nr:S-layer homology domain-containing protein [Candidatus Peribacteria bacterium]